MDKETAFGMLAVVRGILAMYSAEVVDFANVKDRELRGLIQKAWSALVELNSALEIRKAKP